MIIVTLIPILKDNYAYLLEADNGERAVIDPGDAAPIIEFLDSRNIDHLDYIINTHHHWDHTDGNADMLAQYRRAKHVGPAAEERYIGELDIPLREGDEFIFGGEAVQIIETPGHTLGHICLYFLASGLAFVGDTLFSMGCGRLFEGTPAQMWSSFEKLLTLPDDTKIYCGHEYTLGNIKFAQHIEPDNQDIEIRAEEVKALRRKKKPTLPSTIRLEKKTNVFLRAGSAERFAEIRSTKDQF